MHKISTEYEKMFNNITQTFAEYLTKHDIRTVVLGVSGGVDSALIAALALNTKPLLSFPLNIIGRSITIDSNKPDEIARAKAIGELFCDDFKELDLTYAYGNLKYLIEAPTFVSVNDKLNQNLTAKELAIANGNIKARIRMIQLYHLAGINKGMVLSTDNLTELYMGFWTLHGDVGDYGMIQNLWKTEVYGLTKHIAAIYDKTGAREWGSALRACVRAVPTDGLGITNSDLDQLGARTYEDVDSIIIDYLNTKRGKHPVIDRYEATHYKRTNPVHIPRKEILS